MPSKSKLPPKPDSKSKKHAKPPRRTTALVTAPDPSAAGSADDHLAACVALEESGDKHRAGDAAKACRFYVKAMEGYEGGLGVWGVGMGGSGGASGGGGSGGEGSAVFDMGYNLARLQYQITQHPSLRHCFPGTIPSQLQTALSSHRRALALVASQPSSISTATAYADVLFNTAQVLSSLAEAVGGTDGAGDEEARNPLREAVELFRDCLGRQGVLFEEGVRAAKEAEAQAEVAAAEGEEAEEDGGAAASAEEGETEQERWASVVEPVTKQSLLDTATALLDALGSLSVLLDVGDTKSLHIIEDAGAVIMTDELPAFTHNESESVAREAWLATAKFKTSILEAEFRQRGIDVQTFEQRLKEVFVAGAGVGEVVGTQDYLCAYADALIAFAAAVAETPNVGTLRWTCLTSALDRLTEASKLPALDDAATLHIGGGDVEMLRFMLCRSGTLSDNLSSEGVQLTVLKNAGTYYRAAVSVAQATFRNALDQTLPVSKIKAAVTEGLLKNNGRGLLAALVASKDASEQLVKEVLDDMVDEDLIPESMLRTVGII